MKKIPAIYFDNILPPPALLRLSLPLHSPNSTPFLFHFKKQNKQAKKKNDQTKQYESQGYKHLIEFILCWPNAPGHGIYPGVWLAYPLRLHWRKSIFPCQQVSIVGGFLIRGGSLCYRVFVMADLGCHCDEV